MTLAGVLSRVVDFCYPSICAHCDGDCETRSELCSSCVGELERLETAPSCPCCAMPLPTQGSPCPHCHGQGVGQFERVLRLGVFDDPIRHLIHEMKYRRQWNLGEFLADRLLASEQVRGLLHHCDCLVPVPLHFRRQVLRGYNPSEVIASRLARRSNRRLVRAVVRLRNTPSQTNLSVQLRARNVRDAFGLIKPRQVAGKSIVLVDDVMTTGATLRAVARTLCSAKPASISAIIVAIADPKHRGFEVI
jgi:ComF family protein